MAVSSINQLGSTGNKLKGVGKTTTVSNTIRQMAETHQVLYGPGPSPTGGGGRSADAEEIVFEIEGTQVLYGPGPAPTGGHQEKPIEVVNQIEGTQVLYAPPTIVKHEVKRVNNNVKTEDITNIDFDKCQKTVDSYKGKDVASLSNEEFLDLMTATAQLEYLDSGILPSVTIAQAIIESKWGDQTIGNNLYHIPADDKWEGMTVGIPNTYIDDNGNEKVTRIEYKYYDSIQESIRDHNTLYSLERYKPVIEACNNNDPIEACKKINECGYTTSPNYANTLISVIDGNDLTQYDPKFQ